MSLRNVAGLLGDIETAACFIESRAAGHTLETYVSNEDLQAIVERKFEIIGEALSALRRIAPDTFASIRHAQQAVDFRNVLIHGYASSINTSSGTPIAAGYQNSSMTCAVSGDRLCS